MPKSIEDLKALNDADLAAALTEAIASQKELAGLSDDDLTDEKLAEFEQVVDLINAAKAETTERATAAQARADRVAAARAASEEPEPPAEDPVDPPEEPVEDATPAPKEEELVTAAGSVVARAAANAPTPVVPEVVPIKPAAIIAAANIPDFSAGADLVDFGGVAEAYQSRIRTFAGSAPAKEGKSAKALKGMDVMDAEGGVYQLSEGAMRYGLARIDKPVNEFSTGLGDSVNDQMEVILAAAREDRLPGGSLVAAGGWCAPSETLYGPFCSLETISGILSIPEIHISRGGINFTKGPDYATLAASWGFLQTEAQAIAGTTKTCYAVACPPFTDVRMDVVGFCVTNGVLTNVGYPELARRVLEIGAVAHAHKVNASVISRIVAFAGAAIDYTEVGGTVTDLLGAIETSAEVTRYKYALAVGATIEVVLPAWARVVARQDYANRNGNTDISPTDAEVTAWFTKRNLAVQWVYDWQPLGTNTAASQALPTTVNALIYPAGSFVKGTSDVINLDTIYDSVGLSTNTYTAAFFEEGLLVANTCAGALQVAIALNTKGSSGYPSINAPA